MRGYVYSRFPLQAGLDLIVRRFRFDSMGASLWIYSADPFRFWNPCRICDPPPPPLFSPRGAIFHVCTRPIDCGCGSGDVGRMARDTCVAVKRNEKKKTALCSSLGTFVLAGQEEATD